MDFLLGVDLPSYTSFIYAWACLGLVSSIAISFSRQLPISNRYENTALNVLGVVDKKLGWIVMETPILLVVLYFYLAGSLPLNASVVIVGAFVIHYIHRALIFPHRIKVEGKKMPVSMVLVTMIFYIVNGYLVGHYFGSLKSYDWSWLADPRFIIGVVLFIGGFIINVLSDNILINLRKPGETGYKIPHGGLFRYISCPNFFGEIIEWIGFALMCWSLPGIVYSAWVAMTLFFTGLQTHRWYLEKFKEEYPSRRRAVIPGVI